MSDLVKEIIISIGGTAAVLIAIILFLSDKIADRIANRYALKLQKEFEVFKSELQETMEKRILVSKNRFDKEFSFIEQFLSIYCQIKNLMIYVTDSVGEPEFEENHEKMRLEVARLDNYYNEHKILINSELAKDYDAAIFKLAGFLLHSENDNNAYGKDYYDEEMLDGEADAIRKTYTELVNVSRTYLDRLEVTE